MVQCGAPKGKRLLRQTRQWREGPKEEGSRNGGAGYWRAYFSDRYEREVARVMFDRMISVVEYKEEEEILYDT